MMKEKDETIKSLKQEIGHLTYTMEKEVDFNHKYDKKALTGEHGTNLMLVEIY